MHSSHDDVPYEPSRQNIVDCDIIGESDIRGEISDGQDQEDLEQADSGNGGAREGGDDGALRENLVDCGAANVDTPGVNTSIGNQPNGGSTET